MENEQNNEQNIIESHGAIFSPVDVRDYRLQACATAGKEYPEEFELDMVRIKNQGGTGSCVAFSLSEVIEYFNSIQNNNKAEMSTAFIYGNRKNSSYKNSGMVVRDALGAICKYGDVYYTDLPGNEEVPEAINKFEKSFEALEGRAYPFRISSYYRVNTEKEIKEALMNYGPVVVAVNWRDKTKVDPISGLLTLRGEPDGGHCMVIYGWNKTGWKVQNSWSVFWGKLGTCVIPFNDENIREAWGVTDTIVNEDIVRPKHCKFLVKIFNFILNLFKKS